jgi:hypothetical protein
MAPITRLSGTLLLTAALAVPATARWVPVIHLTGNSVESSSPARLGLRPVDIVVNDWSSVEMHRLLARTLVEKGAAAFTDVLCAASPLGSIAVPGNLATPIRYAWQAVDRSGSQRLFLASDSPISLTAWWFEPPREAGSSIFLEIRLDGNGYGFGKLGDARDVSFDENGDLIGLRDYDSRPAQLMMVRRIEPVD